MTFQRTQLLNFPVRVGLKTKLPLTPSLPPPHRKLCLWRILSFALPAMNGPLPADLKFRENTGDRRQPPALGNSTCSQAPLKASASFDLINPLLPTSIFSLSTLLFLENTWWSGYQRSECADFSSQQNLYIYIFYNFALLTFMVSVLVLVLCRIIKCQGLDLVQL